MTIFFDVVKEMLKKEIDSIHSASVNADESYPSRDTAISKKKRAELDSFIVALLKLSPTTSDDENVGLFQGLITTCRGNLDIARGNQNPGNTEGKLTSLGNIVTTIKQRFNILGLIDIQLDDNPVALRLFRHQVARYTADEILRRSNKSIPLLVFEATGKSYSLPFESEIDSIIKGHLESATKSAINAKNAENMEGLFAELIKSKIDNIETDYKEQQTKHTNFICGEKSINFVPYLKSARQQISDYSATLVIENSATLVIEKPALAAEAALPKRR